MVFPRQARRKPAYSLVVDDQSPTRWLAWELLKYGFVVIVTWLLIVVLPGEPPRWLQWSIFLLVVLTTTLVLYRLRVSRRKRDASGS